MHVYTERTHSTHNYGHAARNTNTPTCIRKCSWTNTLFLFLAVTYSAPPFFHLVWCPTAHTFECVCTYINAFCVYCWHTPPFSVLTRPLRPLESGVLIRKSSHARSLAHCAWSAHARTHIFLHGITYIPVGVVALALAKPFPLCCVWFSLGFFKKWKT